MAKTYYGYVERDDKAYVDWASIGKTITDDLIRVGNERTQKREQLETDVTNSLSTFEKLTANQPPIASEYYMTAAENMRNWMLQQQKLMKAGQISVSDFTRKRQVLMDGVEQMAANSKLYNAWLQENMDRLDTSSKREKFIQSEAEKFSTNNNLSLFIDDKGYMQNTIVGPNGEISQNPKDFQSVNNLYVTMNDRDDAYDVIGQVSKRVTPLGDYIRAKRSQGVLTLKDIMQNPEYIKAENDIIASMMSNDVQLGSILADFDDTYDYTFSEEEAKKNPNLILLKQNGMGTQIPQVTEEQRKVAEELLRAQIRVQLDRVETPMPIQQPDRAAAAARQQQQRTNAQHLEHLRKLFSGNATEAVVASDAIRAINPNIKSIQKTDDGRLTIKFNDGRVESSNIPRFGTADASAFEQFITQSGRFLIPGLETQQAFIDWGNSEYAGRSQGYRKATVDSMGARDPKSAAMTAIADANMSTASFSMTEEAAMPLVENMLQNLGDSFKSYKFEETSSWGANDQIVISSDDTVLNANKKKVPVSSITLEFDEQNEAKQQAEMQRLLTWLEKEIQRKEAASPPPAQSDEGILDE